MVKCRVGFYLPRMPGYYLSSCDKAGKKWGFRRTLGGNVFSARLNLKKLLWHLPKPLGICV